MNKELRELGWKVIRVLEHGLKIPENYGESGKAN